MTDKIPILREVLSAIEGILEWKPQLNGKVFGSTTLGNLRAEVAAEIELPDGFQLVSEVAIKWLFEKDEEIYDGFYDRVNQRIRTNTIHDTEDQAK